MKKEKSSAGSPGRKPVRNSGHKTLVLGLGNPILSDDGAGCRVALALKEKLDMPRVDIQEAAIAGLEFLEMVAGYRRAIIIDAIKTGSGAPGEIYRLSADALSDTLHSGSPHDVNIATALKLGKKLKMKLPRDITIFAIEVADITSFSENCTPAVTLAIPRCVEMIVRELRSAA